MEMTTMNAPFVAACPKCQRQWVVEPSRTYNCPDCRLPLWPLPGNSQPPTSRPPTEPPPYPAPHSPPKSSADPLLSLDDDDAGPCPPVQRPQKGLMVAVVIVGLLAVGGVVGAVFYFRDADRQPRDSAEAQPSKEPRSTTPAVLPSPQMVPQPPGQQVSAGRPALLPQPASPQELTGAERSETRRVGTQRE